MNNFKGHMFFDRHAKKQIDNIDAEVIKEYRELRPQASIAKKLYLTVPQVRWIIKKNLSASERKSIAREINRRLSSKSYNITVRQRKYLVDSIQNLYHNKKMDLMEISCTLHISQDKIKEILGIVDNSG